MIDLNLFSLLHQENLNGTKLRLKFVFIFMGPKRRDLDYYEISRCMGTLMTQSVSQRFLCN